MILRSSLVETVYRNIGRPFAADRLTDIIDWVQKRTDRNSSFLVSSSSNILSLPKSKSSAQVIHVQVASIFVHFHHAVSGIVMDV